MEDLIKCPKCGSAQISAGKKGFSGSKAVAGAVFTGGIGLLAGTIGSSKVVITCLKCGAKFKPGRDMDSALAKKAERDAMVKKNQGLIALILLVIIVIVAIIW